jgi:hypothetical protein
LSVDYYVLAHSLVSFASTSKEQKLPRFVLAQAGKANIGYLCIEINNRSPWTHIALENIKNGKKKSGTSKKESEK